MPFPNSNLAPASQPWARDVQKRVESLESNIKANEINNTARDVQLDNNYKRLDKAVNDLIVADASIAIAVQQASDAATVANNAITALGQLDEATSTYKINAANLTVGTLSGDRISGGTITGTTLETAFSGRRVKISGTTATFYDESSNYSGTITVSGYANESVMQINGPFTNRSISFSAVNTYISGGGGTYINLSDEPRITLGGNVTISGNTTLSGITVASSNMRVDGTSFSLPNITDSTAAANTRWGTTTSGRLFYISSARRAKYDIQDAAVGLEALNLRPRTWFDMNEYLENGNSTEGLVRIPGFVAEEVLEAGLEEFVTYNADGSVQGLSYDRMVAAVIPVIKHLNDQIEQLKTEIESLKGA